MMFTVTLCQTAPTQTSNDLPRALTEFGQQAEVIPAAGLYLEWP